MIIAIFLIPLITFGQETVIKPVTKTIAFTNATIVPKAGMSLNKATVLIKDGLIVAVGSNIVIPPDAEVINGDSLYIYPGFIDALSHAGIPKPEEKKEKKEVDKWYPPNEDAGITPEVSISETFNPKESSLDAMRKVGFTISHVVPLGGMMPGKGSIILLNEGELSNNLILENTSLFAQLSPAKGMYPGTLIGVLAKWRELYHNATNAYKYEASYKNLSNGKKRPSYDEAIRGLYPVVSANMPVYFKAESALDLHRVLQLSKELGFVIVPSEVKQGWEMTDRLKQSSKGVLISLELPKDMEEKKEEKKEDGDKNKEEAKNKEPKKEEKKEKSKPDPEKEGLLKRMNESKKAYASQAAMMEKAGVSFAFSNLESKPKDVLKNIGILIKNGLSEKAAIEALTSNAAAILNISNIAGTIEAGKLGNLVISTKPIFDDKAQIKYVVIEGKKYENDIKSGKNKKVGDGQLIDLSGTWIYEIDVPGMVVEGEMILTKNGDSYDIAISNNQDSGDVKNVSGVENDNNNLSFSFDVIDEGTAMTLDMDLDFTSDSLEGDVRVGDFGSFKVTGSKKSPNK